MTHRLHHFVDSPAPNYLRRRLVLATMAGALAACGSRSAADFERLWSRVHGVAVGASSGPRLLVFFDTRCGYCTQLWHTVQPLADSWQMLWVPVAILARASHGEALALLSSGDPQAWLQAHMNRQSLPLSVPNADLGPLLAANLKALDDLHGGGRGVPQSVGIRQQAMHVVRGALPLDRVRAEFG